MLYFLFLSYSLLIDVIMIPLLPLLFAFAVCADAGPSFADPNAQSFHSQSGFGSDYYSGGFDLTGGSFRLDPALVTEVEDDYVEDDFEQAHAGGYSDDHSHSHGAAAAAARSHMLPPKGDPTIDLPTLARHPSKRRFSVTADGYKSFKGGWIEGLSEDNNIYYYNIRTGESSWHLPGAHLEDVHEQVEDDSLVDDVNLGEDGAEQNHSIAQAADAAAAATGLPHVPHELQQPSHYFEQTLEDYQQHHYNDYPYHDPQAAAHYYDPNYHHDPYAADPQQQQQQLQQYHDPNAYPNHGQLNDDHYHPQDPNAYHGEHYPAEGYYDEYGNYHDPYADPTAAAAAAGHHQQQQQQHDPDYHGDGTWGVHDALGEHAHDHAEDDDARGGRHPHPRTLPVPVKADVAAYSKKEGVDRQLTLLNTQDRWQNALVKTQHIITEQKSQYLQLRVEMFEKVSQRVDARLNTFVDDIKFMQKSLKKDLGESVSTERDLRRLFEQQGEHVVQAEKLSFILESLEKFKVVASERYESAFTQIEKFGAEWEVIKTELLQVGNIYDEGVSSNLEQCRLACEHNAKLFVYDQLKQAGQVKKNEMRALRNALHRQLRADTHEQEAARAKLLVEHRAYNMERNKRKAALHRELFGWGDTIEAELREMGYPPIDPELEAVPEEEAVMSFMLTQIEMELSLAGDYDSIQEATRSMAIELNQSIQDLDETEKSVSHIQYCFDSITISSVLYFIIASVITRSSDGVVDILVCVCVCFRMVCVGGVDGRQLVQQASRNARAARAGAAHDADQSPQPYERGISIVRNVIRTIHYQIHGYACYLY